jgi:hypothetical protein
MTDSELPHGWLQMVSISGKFSVERPVAGNHWRLTTLQIASAD